MAGMERIDIIGHAESGDDSFDFKIGPWVGKVGLMVRRSSRDGTSETGAGRWDSVDKAKEIAKTMVHRTFGSTSRIEWSEPVG